MKNYKKYVWKGLGVIAFLLLAVGVVRAAVSGFTFNIQNWSGNLVSSDSSSSSEELDNLGAGYNQGKLIPIKYNFDQGFAVKGVDVMSVDGALTLAKGASLASTTLGGAVTTLTASTLTTTISAANVCDSTYIGISASSTGGAVEVLWPTTTTLYGACLNANGKSHSFLLVNASSTVGSSAFISAAGIELISTSTAKLVLRPTWAGGMTLEVTMTRITDTTTTVKFK